MEATGNNGQLKNVITENLNERDNINCIFNNKALLGGYSQA